MRLRGEQSGRTRAGLAFGLGAYLSWGVFPVFFTLIEMVGPFEVVPWRVSTTLLFCALLVTVMRGWGRVRHVLRSPRVLGWYTLSGVLLYVNWQIFILGVMTGNIIETALGYFINPLFTILIGVVVRRERLTRLQWIAVAIAAVGVLIAAVAYGSFPWIALGLAITFALYGAVHKQAGEAIDGVTGLTVETLVTSPLAVVQLVVVAGSVGVNAFTFGPGISVLVLCSGVLTAIPLSLFGEAVRRLPLSYIGFLQFITPILTFLFGYFVMHEAMPVSRWVGFVAVWCALTILITEMVLQLRRSPSAEPNTSAVHLD
ncbi:MAG: EamA family transporter RarD [Leucobacter sp.]